MPNGESAYLADDKKDVHLIIVLLARDILGKHVSYFTFILTVDIAIAIAIDIEIIESRLTYFAAKIVICRDVVAAVRHRLRIVFVCGRRVASDAVAQHIRFPLRGCNPPRCQSKRWNTRIPSVNMMVDCTYILRVYYGILL